MTRAMTRLSARAASVSAAVIDHLSYMSSTGDLLYVTIAMRISTRRAPSARAAYQCSRRVGHVSRRVSWHVHHVYLGVYLGEHMHIPTPQLRWNTALCNACYDVTDKSCTRCRERLPIDATYSTSKLWGTGYCAACYNSFTKARRDYTPRLRAEIYAKIYAGIGA